MPLPTKTFNELVSDQVTAIQSVAGNFEFATGSFALASVEANAGVALWLQGVMLQLLAYSRATSCTGVDLDSWMADYAFVRLGAVSASGNVTFARATPTNAAFIESGFQVQTSVGSIVYAVYADPTNPNYNPFTDGYDINPGVTSISVPVIALVPGAAGNASAGSINELIQPIVGVDTVTNPLAFTNGADQESDQAFRDRFFLYFNSLSKATLLAVQATVASIQSNIVYNIAERINISGATELGFFTVIIDDGSGAPPASLIQTVSDAVNRVRPLTVNYSVYPVVPLTANIAVNVVKNPLYHDSDIEADIKAAIANFFTSLTIGDTLIFNRLYQVIYDSTPGIRVITSLLINGATSNIVANFKERVYAGTVTISIT